MQESVRKRSDAWRMLLSYGAYISRGDLRRAMCAARAECADGARDAGREKAGQSLRNYDENT